MQADPFVWILPASAALSIAATLILLSASEYDSLIEPIGLILGVLGIAIGLIIAHSQKKQGKRITETLEEIRRVDREARARDNRRKNYHLFFIRSKVSQGRRRVSRRSRRIQQNIIENHHATLEQWNRERDEARRDEAWANRAIELVSVHFDAINDLMIDFELAADVNRELRIIVNLLTAIHGLENPTINQSHDQHELRRLLQELNQARERLNNLLPRIEHEVPQMEAEQQGRG